MPRVFVNAMTDFVVQGGCVSFTLADHALKSEGERLVAQPPEQVARVVMREGDFAELVKFLNAQIAEFERRTGRKMGAGEER